MRFDARAAKTLAAGTSIVYEDAKGLRLEATASKRSWIYRYKSLVDGRMRQLKLGEWPAMGWPAAVAKWQDLKTLRDAGGDPVLERKQQRQKAAGERTDRQATVLDVVEAYASGHLAIHREPKGAKAVGVRLRSAVCSFSDLPAVEVSRKLVFDLIVELSDRPVLAKSVKAEMAAAWDLALDAETLPSETPNWWRQVKGPKLQTKGALREGKHKGLAKRILKTEELRDLIRNDIYVFSSTVQDVIVLYLWTCARGVELVQMHTDDIRQDADGWWWTLPKEKIKNRNRSAASDFRVPLLGRALEVVLRRKQAQGIGFIFPSASERLPHITQASVQSMVHFHQPYSRSRPDVIRRRLSISHWSPHDLRRTGRTLLAALGCPHEVAEAIIGHLVPGVAGIYNLHHYDEQKRHWLGVLASRLEEVAA